MMFSPQSQPPSSSTPRNNDAVIIFDWDDTILPSSFVDRCQADNLNQLPQQYHGLFREIEICTETCLAEAAKHGEVRSLTVTQISAAGLLAGCIIMMLWQLIL